MRPDLRRLVLEPWSPRKLMPLRWYEFDDLSSLRQLSDGTTAVTAANDPIGFVQNKGSGAAVLTQATAGSRPLFKTDLGYRSARLDGVDDHLFDTSPGLEVAGAAWMFMSGKFNPAVSRYLFSEGSSASAFPIYGITSDPGLASTMDRNLRNNEDTQNIAQAIVTFAFDNTTRVIGWTDTGTTISGFRDGIMGTPSIYARIGTFTADRFAIGGLLRASFALPFAADIQRIVAGTGILAANDRVKLITYLGAGVGLTL